MKKLLSILLILSACKPILHHEAIIVPTAAISYADSLKNKAETFMKCANKLNDAVSDNMLSEHDRNEFIETQLRFLDSAAYYSDLANNIK
ncbi:MAG TPA: hypothetical protein VN698_16395 [Bacteroidia bacterium]|nr:hypothetical protein [Bacteroidia bacterium]